MFLGEEYCPILNARLQKAVGTLQVHKTRISPKGTPVFHCWWWSKTKVEKRTLMASMIYTGLHYNVNKLRFVSCHVWQVEDGSTLFRLFQILKSPPPTEDVKVCCKTYLDTQTAKLCRSVEIQTTFCKIYLEIMEIVTKTLNLVIGQTFF